MAASTLWILTTVVACGTSQTDAVLADAATGEAAPRDAPGADASPADAPASCAAGKVARLDVHPVVANAVIPDGRLVVVFYQLNDDIQPAPIQAIAYDRPFVGASTRVDLALADVVLPAAIDDYQLCVRACIDLANPACDCPAAEPKVALAAVLVLRDINSSGAIEVSEVSDANTYGLGYLQLGAADRAYPAPNALDVIARDGIQDCLAPYSILPPPASSSFDDLGIPAAGATFTLNICVPGDPSCDDLPTPNLI